MPRLLRYWWVLPIGLAVLAAIGLALGPMLRGNLQQATGSGDAQPCSPTPCAAPKGFEADISNVQSANGTTSFDVTFKNHTAADLGTTSYRPTTPHDFRLRLKNGDSLRPVFGAGCPDWGELHVERGSSAGPVRLCFKTSATAGAVVAWSPDLGFLFVEVGIPLA